MLCDTHGQDMEGQVADHFDQGYYNIAKPLSGWVLGHRELLPSPAVLVLSLLSLALDTSKPFKFKPNEWTWLSDAMDKVNVHHAVIALRIRADHLCAMMAVLSALKYFVDSVPYAIGETELIAPRGTELITGFIITAAKSKKNLEDISNAKSQI